MCDKGNNEILLNAIKNKFASQSADSTAANSSPPKFFIPVLKASTNISLNNNSNNQLSKPEDKKKNTSNLNGIFLKSNTFMIPILKSASSENNKNIQVSEIAQQIQDLRVHNEADLNSRSSNIEATAIDLTKALRDAPHIKQNVEMVKQQRDKKMECFNIPFIACDGKWLDKTSKKDITQPRSNNSGSSIKSTRVKKSINNFKEPSPFARVLGLSYISRRIVSKVGICHEFKVKHKINPFHFETKSPDDIILGNLSSKIHRKT